MSIATWITMILVLAFVFLLLAGYVHAFGYPWSAH